MKRVEKLLPKIEGEGLDALLVSQGENRRYLSGFDGSAGFLLISPHFNLLATDFRYVEQAKRQSPDYEVVEIKGEIYQWLPRLASDMEIKKLGLEAQDIPMATYYKLKEAVKDSPLELIPIEGWVEELRMVKEKEELEFIEKAVKLADAAMEHISHYIRRGMREREIAWELEKFLREKGSQSLPFEIVVASALNSALPHAKPTDRPIGGGEPIVIDIGAKIGGYNSDLTRTLFLGNPDPVFERIYHIILEAQKAALEGIREGMSGEEADALSREVIEKAGFGSAFGHGLGHGIGLAPHENPRLGLGSSHILSEGMVFTIEPGIYLPDWGGVRVEDVVVLEKGRLKVLSQSEK